MKYELTTDIDRLREWLLAADYSHLVWDTETYDLRKGSPLLGISFYDGVLTPIFAKADNSVWSGITVDEFREVFIDVDLHTANGVGQNMKYDVGVFRNYKLPYPKRYFDTLVAAHLIDSEQRLQLEILVEKYLDCHKKTFEEVVGKKWLKIDFSEIGMDEKMAHYSCEDCYTEYQLYELLSEELRKQKLEKLFYEIEIPLIDCLSDMWMRGVRIDTKILTRLGVRLDAGIILLEQDIYEKSGCEFNINSSKQLGEVLFDKLGYPSLKFTPKGARSTDSKVLKKLAERGFPIAEKLVKYSELETLNSTFVKAIPKFLYPDGRLRSDFNSSGTTSGRFSSSKVNLQNMPNNIEYSVRAAYIPSEGYGFVVSDASQIELRVMAHASRDKAMMKTFLEGGDIHGAVAEEMGVSRKAAKILNFGILYGMGKSSLASFLNIAEGEAQRIINHYHTTYSGYSYWSKKVEEFAEEHGYVRTIFGRIRRLPNAMLGGGTLYFDAMRQSTNTMIQGGAADLIKIAMIKLHKEFKNEDCHMLLQVHDEIVCEVRKNIPGRYYYIEEMADRINWVLSHAVELIIPTPFDTKIVNNWAQMKQDSFQSIDRRNNFNPAICLL